MFDAAMQQKAHPKACHNVKTIMPSPWPIATIAPLEESLRFIISTDSRVWISRRGQTEVSSGSEIRKRTLNAKIFARIAGPRLSSLLQGDSV